MIYGSFHRKYKTIEWEFYRKQYTLHRDPVVSILYTYIYTPFIYVSCVNYINYLFVEKMCRSESGKGGSKYSSSWDV